MAFKIRYVKLSVQLYAIRESVYGTKYNTFSKHRLNNTLFL